MFLSQTQKKITINCHIKEVLKLLPKYYGHQQSMMQHGIISNSSPLFKPGMHEMIETPRMRKSGLNLFQEHISLSALHL